MLHAVAALTSGCTYSSDGTLQCPGSESIGAVLGLVLIFYVVVFAVTLWAWVKIISKAGFSGWWVLISFVPILNIVFFFIFAFSDWPVLQHLQRAQQYQAFGGYQGRWSQPAPSYSSGPAGVWASAPPGSSEPPAPPSAPFAPASHDPSDPLPPFARPTFTAPTPQSQGGPAATPPGWYPAGDGERFWNGTDWTDQTR